MTSIDRIHRTSHYHYPQRLLVVAIAVLAVLATVFPIAQPPGAQASPEHPLWVALGDSYSSGEGTGVYDPETDLGRPERNGCHRGPGAYSRYMKARGWMTQDLVHVACSGATIRDYYQRQRRGRRPRRPLRLGRATTARGHQRRDRHRHVDDGRQRRRLRRDRQELPAGAVAHHAVRRAVRRHQRRRGVGPRRDRRHRRAHRSDRSRPRRYVRRSTQRCSQCAHRRGRLPPNLPRVDDVHLCLQRRHRHLVQQLDRSAELGDRSHRHLVQHRPAEIRRHHRCGRRARVVLGLAHRRVLHRHRRSGCRGLVLPGAASQRARKPSDRPGRVQGDPRLLTTLARHAGRRDRCLGQHEQQRPRQPAPRRCRAVPRHGIARRQGRGD